MNSNVNELPLDAKPKRLLLPLPQQQQQPLMLLHHHHQHDVMHEMWLSISCMSMDYYDCFKNIDSLFGVTFAIAYHMMVAA
jgi:hypothetical protein